MNPIRDFVLFIVWSAACVWAGSNLANYVDVINNTIVWIGTFAAWLLTIGLYGAVITRNRG